MKWLGLPLMLLLVLTSPATLAANCGSQSAAMDTACACCKDSGSCCLDSTASAATPIKTAFAPAPELPTLAAPQFTCHTDWFTPPVLQRVQRSRPPIAQVRPPPDPVRLCTFLI